MLDRRLRLACVVTIAIVGAAFVAGGAAHMVGVTGSAAKRSALFDGRHAELLTIGWALVAPGGALLASARGVARGEAWALPVALAMGAFLFVVMLLVGGALGTREQVVPALAAAVACLALWAFAWRRGRASAKLPR